MHFSVRLTHEPCLQHGETRSCTWKRARRRFRSQTSFWTVSSWASKKALRSSLWEHLLVVVCRTLNRRPRENDADPVFFKSILGKLRRLSPDDEQRDPREPREQPLRIDVRLVHTNTEPAKPRRVYIRNSVELARYGYTLDALAVKHR